MAGNPCQTLWDDFIQAINTWEEATHAIHAFGVFEPTYQTTRIELQTTDYYNNLKRACPDKLFCIIGSTAKMPAIGKRSIR